MVTQQDVAERAGVTRATVSYVLNGRAEELHITADVVKRVRDAADVLGYIPNNTARALVSGKTYTLGLLIARAEHGAVPFWSRIAEGVEAQALSDGYSILLLSSLAMRSPDDIRRICCGRIDALIALGVGFLYADAVPQRLPFPVILVQPGGARTPSHVSLDPAPGIAAAVQHLAQLGHRRIAWMGPPPPASLGRDVLVQAAAHACHITCNVYYTAEQEHAHDAPVEDIIAHWRAQLEPLLSHAHDATAILCWNDRMALGLYSLLAARGVRIPQDMSVIGFDDWEAGMALPPMSTVSHELHALGRAAASLALRVAHMPPQARDSREESVLVAARFVPRASTGPAQS